MDFRKRQAEPVEEGPEVKAQRIVEGEEEVAESDAPLTSPPDSDSVEVENIDMPLAPPAEDDADITEERLEEEADPALPAPGPFSPLDLIPTIVVQPPTPAHQHKESKTTMELEAMEDAQTGRRTWRVRTNENDEETLQEQEPAPTRERAAADRGNAQIPVINIFPPTPELEREREERREFYHIPRYNNPRYNNPRYNNLRYNNLLYNNPRFSNPELAEQMVAILREGLSHTALETIMSRLRPVLLNTNNTNGPLTRMQRQMGAIIGVIMRARQRLTPVRLEDRDLLRALDDALLLLANSHFERKCTRPARSYAPLAPPASCAHPHQPPPPAPAAAPCNGNTHRHNCYLCLPLVFLILVIFLYILSDGQLF